MADLLIVLDTSEIREGKREELERGIAELAAFVEANETAPISHQVFSGDDGRLVTVLQVHPDSASMHRRGARPPGRLRALPMNSSAEGGLLVVEDA